MKYLFALLLLFSFLVAAFLTPAGFLVADHCLSDDAWVHDPNDAQVGGFLLCIARSSVVASAAITITTLEGFIGHLHDIVGALVPFIMGLMVLAIVWGIFLYIAHGGDEEKRKEGGKFMLWGIIGLFVTVSIWGLVGILALTFPLDTTFKNEYVPELPSIGVR